MRIAFCGAQGTGKTTLINYIHEELLPGYIKQSESVRYLKDTFGFDIYSGNIELQLALLTWQTKALLSNTNILLDRSVIDSTTYMMYYHEQNNPRIPDSVRKFIITQAVDLASSLDLIVFLKPEFDLEADGVRVVDVEQQKEITERMAVFIQISGIEEKVIIPTGSVEERALQVLRRVNV